MADTKPGLRKPAFTKVDQLRPGTSGHNVTVKIVSTKMVLQKGRADGPQARQMRISECVVGDETGIVVFTARNDQVNKMREILCYLGFPPDLTHLYIGAISARNVRDPRAMDLMKEGTTVTLRNAKIDMYKGSMRLAVDKWGRVEVTETASFKVKEDTNMSLIEYELVNAVE
ncbi:hypothetical protein YC2023_109863 [Brassica napus]